MITEIFAHVEDTSSSLTLKVNNYELKTTSNVFREKIVLKSDAVFSLFGNGFEDSRLILLSELNMNNITKFRLKNCTLVLLTKKPSKVLCLKFSGQNLKKMDLLSESDPYFTVSRGEDVVYKSEVISNCANPVWKVAEVPLDSFGYQLNDKVRISCFDHNFTTDKKIGDNDVSLRDLLNSTKLEINESNKITGTLNLKAWIKKPKNDFKMKIPLRFSMAIDFFDCKRKNEHVTSPHHLNPFGGFNKFQSGMQLVAGICKFAKLNFNLLGFGGTFENSENVFDLSDSQVDLFSALRIYQETVPKLFSATVCLAPVIKKLSESICHDSFNVFFILTSGNIDDELETIKELKNIIGKPCCFVFCGVGTGNFDEIEKIAKYVHNGRKITSFFDLNGTVEVIFDQILKEIEVAAEEFNV